MSKDKQNSSVVGQAATAKFSVLTYPGEVQESTNGGSSSAAPSGGGLQGRRLQAGGGPKMISSHKIGGDSFVTRTANPSWLKDRVQAFDKIQKAREAELSAKTPIPITVTMPDGKVLEETKDNVKYQAWQTTPFQVAATIAQGLADNSTVARVTYADFAPDYSLAEDGMAVADTLSDAMADGGIEDSAGDSEKTFLWDMQRPLVGNVAKLEFLKFENDVEAKTVFWHSSAHMMGEALEHLFGNKLTIGPPLAGGFYYDSYMGGEALREEDCTWRKVPFDCVIVQLFRSSRLFWSCRSL